MNLGREMVLRVNRTRHTLLLGGSVLMTLGGVWMLRDGNVIGWLPLIFFGACCLVLTIHLLPSASYLRLTDQGFTIRSMYLETQYQWSDIERFQPGPNSTVGWTFAMEYPLARRTRRLATHLVGTEGMLPDTYGQSPAALVRLLNEWKGCAGATQE